MQPGLGCGAGLGWLTCAGKLWRSRSPCGAAMATWMWGGLHNAFAVLEIWEDSNCTALYSFEAPVKQECHRSFSLLLYSIASATPAARRASTAHGVSHVARACSHHQSPPTCRPLPSSTVLTAPGHQGGGCSDGFQC